MVSALGNDSPKCLAVGILALRDVEDIAYLLDDIVFAVIIGQSGVKIGQCAGEVYKLITAHFVKLDAAANLFGDNARRLADALNGLRNADISQKLVYSLNIVLNKLIDTELGVELADLLDEHNPAGRDMVLLGKLTEVTVAGHRLAEYRDIVANALIYLDNGVNYRFTDGCRPLFISINDRHKDRIFKLRYIAAFLHGVNGHFDRIVILLANNAYIRRYLLGIAVDGIDLDNDIAVIDFKPYAGVNIEHDNGVCRHRQLRCVSSYIRCAHIGLAESEEHGG